MRADIVGTKNETHGSQWFWRWLFYVASLVILALGLILNTKAELGVSPIISVAYSVSVIQGWNFGNVTLGLYVVFVAAEFVLKGRDRKLTDALQLVLSIVFTRVINLFDTYIVFDFQHMWQQIVVLLAGIVCTGVGAALSVNMRIVPNPGDGIVAALADKTHKKMGTMKNIFDVCCIVCTIILSLACTGHLVGIGVGTVLAVILVGRTVAVFNHFLLIPMANMTGMAVPPQYLDIRQLVDDSETRTKKRQAGQDEQYEQGGKVGQDVQIRQNDNTGDKQNDE